MLYRTEIRIQKINIVSEKIERYIFFAMKIFDTK